MSDKTKINVNKIKVRKTWNIDPATKVEKSENDYNRAKARKQWQKEQEDEESDDSLDI